MAYGRALFGRPGTITSDYFTEQVARDQPLLNIGYANALSQLRDMPVSSDTIYGEQLLGKARAEQDLLSDMAAKSAGLRNMASTRNWQAALQQAQNRRKSQRALEASVGNLRLNAAASLGQLAPDIVNSLGKMDRLWREEHDGEGLFEAAKREADERRAAAAPVQPKSGLERLRGALETRRRGDPDDRVFTDELASAAMERRAQTPAGQRTDVTPEEFQALQDMEELGSILAGKEAYERRVLGGEASQVLGADADFYGAPSQYSVMTRDADGNLVGTPLSQGEVAAVGIARLRAEGLSGEARIARMSEELKDLGYSVDDVIAADNAIPRPDSGPLFGEIPERELVGGWSEVRPARRPSTSGPRPYEGALRRAAMGAPGMNMPVTFARPGLAPDEARLKRQLLEQIINFQGKEGTLTPEQKRILMERF